jgi:protein TonB
MPADMYRCSDTSDLASSAGRSLLTFGFALERFAGLPPLLFSLPLPLAPLLPLAPPPPPPPPLLLLLPLLPNAPDPPLFLRVVVVVASLRRLPLPAARSPPLLSPSPSPSPSTAPSALVVASAALSVSSTPPSRLLSTVTTTESLSPSRNTSSTAANHTHDTSRRRAPRYEEEKSNRRDARSIDAAGDSETEVDV